MGVKITSNAEHRTPNIERRTSNPSLPADGNVEFGMCGLPGAERLGYSGSGGRVKESGKFVYSERDQG